MTANSQRPQNRETYEKPTVTKLASVGAMLKLHAYADRADPGAKEFLERMLSNTLKDSDPTES